MTNPNAPITADDLSQIAGNISSVFGAFDASNLVSYGRTVIVKPGACAGGGRLISGADVASVLSGSYSAFPLAVTYESDSSFGQDTSQTLDVALAQFEAEIDGLMLDEPIFGFTMNEPAVMSRRAHRIRRRYHQLTTRFMKWAGKALRVRRARPKRVARRLYNRLSRIWGKLQRKGFPTEGLISPTHARYIVTRMVRDPSTGGPVMVPGGYQQEMEQTFAPPGQMPYSYNQAALEANEGQALSSRMMSQALGNPMFGSDPFSEDEAASSLELDIRAETVGYLFGAAEHDYYGLGDTEVELVLSDEDADILDDDFGLLLASVRAPMVLIRMISRKHKVYGRDVNRLWAVMEKRKKAIMDGKDGKAERLKKRAARIFKAMGRSYGRIKQKHLDGVAPPAKVLKDFRKELGLSGSFNVMFDDDLMGLDDDLMGLDDDLMGLDEDGDDLMGLDEDDDDLMGLDEDDDDDFGLDDDLDDEDDDLDDEDDDLDDDLDEDLDEDLDDDLDEDEDLASLDAELDSLESADDLDDEDDDLDDEDDDLDDDLDDEDDGEDGDLDDDIDDVAPVVQSAAADVDALLKQGADLIAAPLSRFHAKRLARTRAGVNKQLAKEASAHRQAEAAVDQGDVGPAGRAAAEASQAAQRIIALRQKLVQIDEALRGESFGGIDYGRLVPAKPAARRKIAQAIRARAAAKKIASGGGAAPRMAPAASIKQRMFRRKIAALSQASDKAEAMGAVSDKGVVVIAIRKNEDPDKVKLRQFTKERLGYESDHLLDVMRTQISDMRGGHSPLMASYVLDQATEPSDFLGAYDAGAEAEADVLDTFGAAAEVGPEPRRGRRRSFPLRRRYMRMSQRWDVARKAGDQKKASFIRGRMETLWPRVRNRKGLAAPGKFMVPGLEKAMAVEASKPAADAPTPPSPSPVAPKGPGGSFGAEMLGACMGAYFAGVSDEIDLIDEEDDIDAAMGLDEDEFGASKRRKRRLQKRRRKMSPKRRRRLVKKGGIKAKHPKRDRYIKLVKAFDAAKGEGAEKKMAHIRGRMAALWPRVKKRTGLKSPKSYKAGVVEEAEAVDESSLAPGETEEVATEMEAAEVDPTPEDEPSDGEPSDEVSGSFGAAAGGRFPRGAKAPFSPPRVAGQEVY